MLWKTKCSWNGWNTCLSRDIMWSQLKRFAIVYDDLCLDDISFIIKFLGLHVLKLGNIAITWGIIFFVLIMRGK